MRIGLIAFVGMCLGGGCAGEVSLSAGVRCDSGLACGAPGALQCVDTLRDPTHCGGCGVRCAAGVTCARGACCVGVSCGQRCFGERFEEPQVAMAGEETNYAYLHDLDRDGFDDLIAVNQQSADLSIWWGNAQGRLGKPTRWRIGRCNAWLAFGDVNGDGRTDIVAAIQRTAGQAAPWLAVYTQQAGRTLAREEGDRLEESGGPNEVALIDTDRDGALDIVARRMDTGCLLVRRGDGRGGFAAGTCATMLPAGPNEPARMATIDLDADGAQELFVMQPSGFRVVRFSPSGVTVDTAPVPSTRSLNTLEVRALDGDGDGRSDLAFIQRVGVGTDFRIEWLPARGGRIATEGCALSGSNTQAVSGAGDFNGDGLPDIFSIISCVNCNYSVALRLRR